MQTGNVKLFIALALEYDSYFRDLLYKVGMVTPCSVHQGSGDLQMSRKMEEAGVFEIGGPTWEET